MKRRVKALSARIKAADCRMQSTVHAMIKAALLLSPDIEMPLVLPCILRASLTVLRVPDLSEFVLVV